MRLVQGVCFHLYTRQRSEALQEFQLPELQRTPLDELCLQVSPFHLKFRCSCVYSSVVSQKIKILSHVRPSRDTEIWDVIHSCDREACSVLSSCFC